MNKAKQLALGIRGVVCPSCGRDNSEYGNICTADDCPGVKPSSREDSLSAKLRERAYKTVKGE
jgi:hypothetical protein